MRIVITGGAGFIGKKLARALLARGTLTDRHGTVQSIREITLFDVVAADGLPDDPRLAGVAGDITDPAAVRRVIREGVNGVFHLAAIVSANAEEDFDLGMRVNLDGTRNVLEACRALPEPLRLVFASSVAVYGGAMPAVLDDGTILTPQTSYGAQKAAGELLLNDYSRKGFVDGRALRLPTIVVRPGKPNAAASSFASGILREPLNGVVSECPVDAETAVWLLSPKRVVEAFVHAHELPAAAWGARRVVNLPGITATVAEMVDALGRVAGAAVAERVAWKPDARIQAIVRTWPGRFETPRALALGFRADPDVETVIRDYIADEGIKPL
jgi:nucleoside-diphosphate-sugar epimerase